MFTMPFFIKNSHFQNLPICRFDLIKSSLQNIRKNGRYIQTKTVKQLSELYKLRRDKKRKSTRNNFLILKAKRCDSTVVSLHFKCFYESFLI